jgi:recombination protein RecR
MTPAFERLQQALKRLPGVGFRSAERIALHLLVEKPERLRELVQSLESASSAIRRCSRCGNLAEASPADTALSGSSPAAESRPLCTVCADPRRDAAVVCVIEHVPDLVALERSAAYPGVYHVLHGRLSPIQGVGPAELNWETLRARLASGEVRELILALGNDVEGEATCHFITEHLAEHPSPSPVRVSRIGFGLPSGGGVLYADAVTLRSALEGRRDYR